jgi:hypothetical protein
MLARGFFSSQLRRVAYRRPERIWRCLNDVDCSLRRHEGVANNVYTGDNIPRNGGALAVRCEDLNLNFEIATRVWD